jgi:hypothetical protein
VIEAALGAVGDRPVGEEAREAAAAGQAQGVVAGDVEEALLLPREGRARQVFRRRRGAHRHRAGRAVALELVIGDADLVPERGGERGVLDELSGRAGAAGEQVGVAQVEALHQLGEPRPEPSDVEQAPVRVGGDREARRDLHPQRAQRAPHLAERGVLASDEPEVIERDLFEPADVSRHDGAQCASVAPHSRSARTVERKLLRSLRLMSAERPSDDELPPTLVIDHLVGLSFDETITPSTHERLSGARERERVQALPQIVDDGSHGDADFTPFEEIAVGGVGVVELAHQRSVGRDVAIKRVRDPSVPGAAAMLLEEGRVMGLLEHPGVIPVLAMGRDGSGHPVLVMKRVEGTTWRALLRDPSQPAWRDFPEIGWSSICGCWRRWRRWPTTPTARAGCTGTSSPRT